MAVGALVLAVILRAQAEHVPRDWAFVGMQRRATSVPGGRRIRAGSRSLTAKTSGRTCWRQRPAQPPGPLIDLWSWVSTVADPQIWREVVWAPAHRCKIVTCTASLSTSTPSSAPAGRPRSYRWTDAATPLVPLRAADVPLATDTANFLHRAVLAGRPLVLVVDVCDIETGEVIHVRARGSGEIVPVDRDRAVKTLARYLGPDSSKWDPRFVSSLDLPTTRLCRFTPSSIEAADVSFLVRNDAGD